MKARITERKDGTYSLFLADFSRDDLIEFVDLIRANKSTTESEFYWCDALFDKLLEDLPGNVLNEMYGEHQ